MIDLTGNPLARPPFPAFVLTGGPAGGKSTGMAVLQQKLRTYGFTPLVVPEMATGIFSSGLSLHDVLQPAERWEQFQAAMLLGHREMLVTWMRFAATLPGKVVLLCDRGGMDGRAYMEPTRFDAMVTDLDLSLSHVRDQPYAAVFHLVTSAIGAREFYTTANNQARTETADEAAALDGKTLDAWTGHRRLSIIGNVQPDGTPVGFDAKIQTLLGEVCRALGIPAPNRGERRFLLAPTTNPDLFPVAVAQANIEQVYLKQTDFLIERRVRRIQPIGGAGLPGGLFIYTEKTLDHPGQLVRERVLRAREYQDLVATERAPGSQILQKVRTSFTYEGLYYHVDQIQGHRAPILEVEMTGPHTDVTPPAFLSITKDITGQTAYRNRVLATSGA